MNIAEYINKQRLLNTFVKLAEFSSGSSECGKLNNTPSTSCQLEFNRMLFEILAKDTGIEAELDKYGILYASMPANIDKELSIGLIAHIDTSDAVPNDNVKPVIHYYKDGGIELNNGVKISSIQLETYKNNTLITSDGTTLLGADDKAGIAEIIETLYVFKEHPELKHPEIKIAFTPDEEIGSGTENFDIKKFGAEYAYTIDGDAPDTIDTETFNAYNPEIIIEGISAHTGYAYNKMVNSIEIANYIINQLPKCETPEKTKDREGFYHIDSIEGSVSKTIIKILIRDFDIIEAQKRVQFVSDIIKQAEKIYANCKITFNPNKKYQNMKEELNKFPQVIENAKEGIRRSGLEPIETAVRGGTDGAELTRKGLPCPNLGCGAENYHSLNEFVSLETMQKCCENIINILAVWAE